MGMRQLSERQTHNLLVAIRDANVPSAQKVALFAILAQGVDAPRMSYAQIAAAGRVSVRTAQRAVAGLRESGWLTVEPETRDDGGKGSNCYRITPPGSR